MYIPVHVIYRSLVATCEGRPYLLLGTTTTTTWPLPFGCLRPVSWTAGLEKWTPQFPTGTRTSVISLSRPHWLSFCELLWCDFKLIKWFSIVLGRLMGEGLYGWKTLCPLEGLVIQGMCLMALQLWAWDLSPHTNLLHLHRDIIIQPTPAHGLSE